MTWASGAWLSSAWAGGAWSGSTQDPDIPVALAGLVLAAANITGQVQPAVEVSAATPANLTTSPSMGQGLGFRSNPASSISIEADLCEGQPTLSELASAMIVAGQLSGRHSVAGLSNPALITIGQPELSTRFAGSSEASLQASPNLTNSIRFNAGGVGGLAVDPDLYIAWPVAALIPQVSSVSGQAWVTEVARATAPSSLAVAMEWRMDQGFAGQTNSVAAITLNPTTSKGLSASTSGGLGLTPTMGWAKSFEAGLSPSLGVVSNLWTASQVAGSIQPTANLYGALGLGSSIKGTVYDLLRTHWATLPPTQAKEYLLAGGGQFELAKAQVLEVKAPARLLYAVSLRTFDVVRKAPANLMCTPATRAWVFDTTNSEYTFEGALDESFGT